MYHDEAVRQHDQILDVFAAVERLHDVSADSLRKSAGKAKGTGAPLVFSLSRGPSKPPFKVDAERLIRALPPHLTACLLGRLPGADTAAALSASVDLRGKPWSEHLCEGLRLLAALCDTAARTPSLCHILEDAGFRDQVVDLALLVLVGMAGPDADDALSAAASPTADGAAAALAQAELVPCALQALSAGAGPVEVTPEGGTVEYGAGGLPAHYEALAIRVLGLPASQHLLDAMFDGVRTLVRMVRAALEAPDAAVDIYQLAFHAGVAMEILAELIATPLFYHRLLLHDPSAAAPLRLVLATLSLHDAPHAPPPFVRGPQGRLSPAKQPDDATTARARGAAELLAARGATLLAMLVECEQPSFLDSVAQHPASHAMARQIVSRLALYSELVLRRPTAARLPPAPGEAQLALAGLRVTEMLADDSNHRAQLMDALAGPAAGALAAPVPEFESSWCGGANGAALHGGAAIPLPIGSITPLALSTAAAIAAAAQSAPLAAAAGGAASGSAAAEAAACGALERGLLLFKLLGNLHAPSDALPEDQFLHLLRSHLPSAAAATAAARNLASLAAWAHKVQGAARLSEDAPPADLLATPEDLGLADDMAAKLQVLASKPAEAVAPADAQKPAKAAKKARGQGLGRGGSIRGGDAGRGGGSRGSRSGGGRGRGNRGRGRGAPAPGRARLTGEEAVAAARAAADAAAAAV